MAKKAFADVFEPFIAAAMDSFGYLTREFGFEHYATHTVSYECSIAFRKDNRVAVHVFCEAGSLPWVMLYGRIGKRVEEAALDFAIEHRCPDLRPDAAYEFPAPEQQMRALVREYASILRTCARDFLAGDPSVLGEVRPAVDADYRRKLREMRREERRASPRRRQPKKR